jgi:signal transduction histidine kinase/ligand-binding sensor domain-containing protein
MRSGFPTIPHWWRRTLAGIVAAVGMFSAGAPWGCAQGATQELGYYSRRWLVDDGLPHNVVNRIVQDGRGFLWVATPGGLARFDGRVFREFPVPALSRDAGINIRDLILEDASTLLLLPSSGGIVRLRDNGFSFHPATAAVAGTTLLHLFAEPNGTLWLGGAGAALMRWQDGKLITFGPAEGYVAPRAGVRPGFAIDGDGRTWVSCGNFLGWYREGRLIRVPIDTQAAIFIAPSRSGGIWIGTTERLLKWDDGQVAVVRDGPAWLPATALAQQLLEDRSGGLWIGTRRQGLFRLAEGNLVPVPTAHYQVSALAEDRESNLWVGVNGDGIHRLRPKTFALLDTTSGLPDNESSSVCEDAGGAIWCADRGNGLVRVRDGESRIFARTETSASIEASNVCPDGDDNLWIGTLTGLYQLPADRSAAIRLLDATIRPVRSLFCTRSGDMWVASGTERTQGYQLGFFRRGVYRPFSAADGFHGQHVVAVTEAADGTVWIGTYDGEVLEYRDGKFEQRLGAEATLAGHIHALHFDASGALWLASERGLILKRGDRVRRFNRADGLPDDLLTQMLEDNHGRLWLCSRRGFFSVAIEDLNALADGRSQRVVATTFGKEEGLPGFSAPTGGQPMAWKSRDGRLWFVTDRGVVGFDPEASLPQRPPPTVYVDEAFVDDLSAPVGAELIIPPGRHRVEFRFVALNYSAPDKVHLRHQLVGFDQDWVETGAGYSARYARLAPGKYSLRVMAANQDGRWSPQGATLTIAVASAWWQTWWFRGAALVASMGLVVWMARYWSHRRLKRQLEQLEHEHALDTERARIARDLHDELGGSLTQIGLLADRLNRHSGGAESAAFGQLARRTRSLAGELESIVWTVNPKNDTWDKLALFLGEFAGRFFQDTPVNCSVEGAETVPPRPLAPDVQHHLLSVAKEAMNNILKHSHASWAKIVIGSSGGNFTLSIRDNGVGFEPDSLEHAERNGLANMRSRIAEIGGAIAISSVRGQGSRIEIRVAQSTRSTADRPSLSSHPSESCPPP